MSPVNMIMFDDIASPVLSDASTPRSSPAPSTSSVQSISFRENSSSSDKTSIALVHIVHSTNQSMLTIVVDLMHSGTYTGDFTNAGNDMLLGFIYKQPSKSAAKHTCTGK